MGKLIKIPLKIGETERLDAAFKPKQPKFRYEKADGQWLKIRNADGERVASRCSGWPCDRDCKNYFKIPASRVSDD